MATILIFFSSESWDSILSKNKKGGPKGGPGKKVFCSEACLQNRKFEKNIEIFNQNSSFPGPPFGPPFKFLKSMESQLSLEKKINVVTILDQNLARFEICNEKSIFQIFTWYSWKSRFSTIYKLEILKTAKRLSRTAMTLIFCSSERWDSILFKNSKGWPGKELFCFEIRLLD